MTGRCRGDRGQVGGLEAIPFGLLVFVAGALLVANAWAVVDARMATQSAAREAARTYVESTDGDTAWADATTAAEEAIRASGRDPAKLGLDGPSDRDDLVRCHRVTIRATYRVPALTIPWLGSFGDGVTVSSQASQVVDPYRAGLDGEADCG